MKNKSFYPWLVVALLWGVALLNYMDRQMLSTMKPAMQVDIPELRSAARFGDLMAVFLWIYAFASPVSGFLGDRLNRKWLIVSSLLVWSAVTFAIGFATNYSQIYVLRALMGISEALYLPAGLSLIADYHSDRTRSLAIGLHMTGLYTGQALGGFGATVAARFSWQSAFLLFGICGISYALLLLLLLHEKREHTSVNKVAASGAFLSAPERRSRLLFNTAYWVILFYFAASSLPGWAAKNWLPTLFAQNLQLNMAQAGPLCTVTVAVASFIGVISGGWLSDRWVQTNLRGRIFTSAIGLVLTVPSLLLLGFGHDLLSVVGAAICFGLGYGMFDANNMPILCQFVPSESRSAAYGLMNMTGVLCGALITTILGHATDAGNLGRDFAMLAFIILVTVVIQLYFLRPKANREQAAAYAGN